MLRDLVTGRRTATQIGSDFGVSSATVERWCEDALRTLENAAARADTDATARERAGQHLRALLDNGTDAIVLLSPEGRVLVFNHAASRRAEALTGFPLVPGDALERFTPPLLQAAFARDFQAALGGQYLSAELQYTSTGGGALWDLAGFAPFWSETGQMAGVCLTLADITPRKMAEETLRRYSQALATTVAERTSELSDERNTLITILDGMTEGVAYYDLRTNQVSYANPALTRLSGYPWRDLVGKSFPELLPTLAHAFTGLEAERHAIWDCVEANRQWEGDLLLTHANDSQLPIKVTILPILDYENVLSALVILIRDVSDEVRLQMQRDRFISNASHELRTPVTSLKLRLGMLRDQPHEVEKHAEAMRRSVDNLVRLVDSLLDLSRYESGVIALSRRPVVMQTLVERTVAELQLRAEQKGVRLYFDLAADPLIAAVDEDRLMQALINVVGNAIKYTPVGGRVRVELCEQDGRITLIVHDTGVGIPPHAIPHLFEAFYRVGNSAEKGTGLGLAITKEIIDMHHGSIEVHSEPGQGSRFTIRLPDKLGE